MRLVAPITAQHDDHPEIGCYAQIRDHAAHVQEVRGAAVVVQTVVHKTRHAYTFSYCISLIKVDLLKAKKLLRISRQS